MVIHLPDQELELHKLRASYRFNHESELGARKASLGHLGEMRAALRELKGDYRLYGSKLKTLLSGLDFSADSPPTLKKFAAQEIMQTYDWDSMERVIKLAERFSSNYRLRTVNDIRAVIARAEKYRVLKKMRELKGKPPLRPKTSG